MKPSPKRANRATGRLGDHVAEESRRALQQHSDPASAERRLHRLRAQLPAGNLSVCPPNGSRRRPSSTNSANTPHDSTNVVGTPPGLHPAFPPGRVARCGSKRALYSPRRSPPSDGVAVRSKQAPTRVEKIGRRPPGRPTVRISHSHHFMPPPGRSQSENRTRVDTLRTEGVFHAATWSRAQKACRWPLRTRARSCSTASARRRL